jgi:hypothetical protein
MFRRIITPEVRHSLIAVIQYLWHDEQKDWEADGRPNAHIFHDVARVAAWLEDEPGGRV